MIILETISLIFTLICVYLTAKQNILCWPSSIVSVSLFFVIYIKQELYFQSILQVIFFTQSIYGWYNWNKLKDNIVNVTSQSKNKLVNHSVISIISSIFIVNILINKPTIIDYLDISSAILSILAIYYLVNKKIEAWFIWMIVNTLLFILMLYQGLYIIAGLEVILFIMSIKAFLLWKKDLKTDYV